MCSQYGTGSSVAGVEFDEVAWRQSVQRFCREDMGAPVQLTDEDMDLIEKDETCMLLLEMSGTIHKHMLTAQCSPSNANKSSCVNTSQERMVL
jgi:hypothetical protein